MLCLGTNSWGWPPSQVPVGNCGCASARVNCVSEDTHRQCGGLPAINDSRWVLLIRAALLKALLINIGCDLSLSVQPPHQEKGIYNKVDIHFLVLSKLVLFQRITEFGRDL